MSVLDITLLKIILKKLLGTTLRITKCSARLIVLFKAVTWFIKNASGPFQRTAPNLLPKTLYSVWLP